MSGDGYGDKREKKRGCVQAEVFSGEARLLLLLYDCVCVCVWSDCIRSAARSGSETLLMLCLDGCVYALGLVCNGLEGLLEREVRELCRAVGGKKVMEYIVEINTDGFVRCFLVLLYFYGWKWIDASSDIIRVWVRRFQAWKNTYPLPYI